MTQRKIHKGFRLQINSEIVIVCCGATVWVKNENWSARWKEVNCKRCLKVYAPPTRNLK